MLTEAVLSFPHIIVRIYEELPVIHQLDSVRFGFFLSEAPFRVRQDEFDDFLWKRSFQVGF